MRLKRARVASTLVALMACSGVDREGRDPNGTDSATPDTAPTDTDATDTDARDTAPPDTADTGASDDADGDGFTTAIGDCDDWDETCDGTCEGAVYVLYGATL